ncbi:hypothetical protein ZOD2009_20672 [Haladaptatus paucihalophilus DX253]|uniref:Uncharacterized protein n=1 Tax=Haladaptatus paucihalophilus DX253 TaxID=797209 RepID=E7QZC7_HALPU|nr:hypothetical protein ZOD2009_20672 [Haladaptatus paucihalophilus DX253]
MDGLRIANGRRGTTPPTVTYFYRASLSSVE